MAVQKNFSITKGDTKTGNTSVFDGNNNPLNLSGYTVNFTCIDFNNNEKFALNTTSGITILDNVISWKIPFSVTENLNEGVYKYDIQIENLPDDRYTIQKGTITITEEITT